MAKARWDDHLRVRLLSDRITPREYWSRFHGCNERIDIDSLTLSLHGWYEVVRRFLG